MGASHIISASYVWCLDVPYHSMPYPHSCHTGVMRCVIVNIASSYVIKSPLFVIKATTRVNISSPIVIVATTCHYVAIPRLPAPDRVPIYGNYGFPYTRLWAPDVDGFSIYKKERFEEAWRFPYTITDRLALHI